DVYAAGITLFESIAGRDPFGAESVHAQLLAHVGACPKLRLRACALVTSELDEIVAKAIEGEREARFPSASAFCSALARSRARYLRARALRRRDAPDARRPRPRTTAAV